MKIWPKKGGRPACVNVTQAGENRYMNEITLYGQKREPYPGWRWRWNNDDLLLEKGSLLLSVHFQYQPAILNGWILVLCHKIDDENALFSFVVDPADWKRMNDARE